MPILIGSDSTVLTMFWHIEIIAGSYWKSWGIFTEISRQQAVIINDYSASVRPLLLPVVSDKSQEIFDTAWIKFAVAKEKVDKQCRWRRAEGVVNQSWHVRTFYISISVKSV